MRILMISEAMPLSTHISIKRIPDSPGYIQRKAGIPRPIVNGQTAERMTSRAVFRIRLETDAGPAGITFARHEFSHNETQEQNFGKPSVREKLKHVGCI